MIVSNPFASPASLPAAEIVSCRACSRLVKWRESQPDLAPKRYRKYLKQNGYWCRPVPAFGDREGSLAVVGLAPAAHGANRTGRMFTGDRSGDFLYAALHRAGLASTPRSVDRNDGLTLRGVLITAAVRCAPPDNRPNAGEAARCRAFLAADLAAMESLRVVLALGRLAHDAVIRLSPPPNGGTKPRFAHGATHTLAGAVHLVDSYHVSQQNTFTGRLTEVMFDDVLSRCLDLCAGRAEAQ